MTTAVNFAGPPGPQVMPVIRVLQASADNAAARQALNACVLDDEGHRLSRQRHLSNSI